MFDSGSISSAIDFARVEDMLLLPDEKIAIGGLSNNVGGVQQNNIARLNSDRSLDKSFKAATDGTVYEIVSQPDEKLLIGGDFETVNNVTRTSLARLLNKSVSANTQMDFDGDGKSDVSVFRPETGVWHLLQSQLGYTAPQFGLAIDNICC